MSDEEEELRALRAQRASRGEGLLPKPQPPARHDIFSGRQPGPGPHGLHESIHGPARDATGIGSVATVSRQATAEHAGPSGQQAEEDEEEAALRAFLPVSFGKTKFQHADPPKASRDVPKGPAAAGAGPSKASLPPDDSRVDQQKRLGTLVPGHGRHGSEEPSDGDEEADGRGGDSEADGEAEERRRAAAAAVEIDEYGLPISNEAVLAGHLKAVTALALDPAGSRLLTGGSDYTVRMYDFGGMKSDLKSFREIEPYEGHPVNVLSWSPTGDAFLAITGAATAKIYTRDGSAVAEGGRGDMYIRDPKNTKGHISALTGGAWHPTDRTTVMTCSEDGTIRLWDVSDELKQKTVVKPHLAKQHRTAVTACAWNSDGHTFAAGLRDGSIQVWSVSDKHFGTSAATPLVPAPKQQMIARQDWSYVGRPDRFVRPAHEVDTDITCLSFNQAGTQLASRSTDGTVKVWDVRRLKDAVHTWDGLPTSSATTMVAWSPDQRLLITGSSSGKAEEAGAVSFFDVTKGTLVRRIGMPGSVAALAWHPRINQIFVGIGNRKSGSTHVLYDPEVSVRGITSAVRRAPRRADPLDYQPPLLIKAPHALPLFREDPTRKRPQRGRDEPDPKKLRMPARGNAVPGMGAQGRIGTTGGTLLTQHILRQKGKLVGVDEELDPREAILRHQPLVESDLRFKAYTAVYAKTQPAPIYDVEDEGDEDEEEEPGKGGAEGQ